jgi:dienelactone hydrolase
MRRSALFFALLAFGPVGCGGDEAPAAKTDTKPSVFASAGPFAVGSTTITLEDESRARTLTVEITYPAAESARAEAEEGFPVADLAPTGPEHDQLAELIAKAPDPATSRTAHSARHAPAAEGGPFPVVVFSHCYDCTRFSTFTIAERLASHGIAVVAPDHAGGTLFDQLAGNDAPLDTAALAVRAADVRFVLDRILSTGPMELPVDLRGAFDEQRVGVFGHSFGGVTAGRVLMLDERPRAGLALAVPMENPLLPGVTVADLHVPLFFLVAAEDHSIGSIGNDLIHQNYADANAPAWMGEVRDAGHWSFTNMCGITDDFAAGCREDVRQVDGEPFTYIDIDTARGLAATYTTAFFAATLEDDARAKETLGRAEPGGFMTLQSK